MVKSKATVKKTPVKTRNTKGLKKGNEPKYNFSTENQPTPQQKREGRERKRVGQKLMDDIDYYTNMSLEELQKDYMIKKTTTVKHGKKSYKTTDRFPKPGLPIKVVLAVNQAYQIATTNAAQTNYIDRHVSMAPTKMEVDATVNLDPSSDVLNGMKPGDIE